MTKEEQKLYSDLQKLVKKANLRIYRLEKLTGKTETFGAKQLADYLSVKEIHALTTGGRISLRQDYTLMQLKAIEKATNEFLKGISTVSKVREYTKNLSLKFGKKISFKYADTYYKAYINYTWIENYFGSEFWKDWYPLTKTLTRDSWVEEIQRYRDMSKEKNLTIKLQALYDYLTGE